MSIRLSPVRGRATRPALPLLAALAAACATGPLDENADSLPARDAANAPAVSDTAAAGRFIVVLRRAAGDTAAPDRAEAARRLAAALRASGGEIVGEVAAIGAVVVAGVRDVEALRRDPAVASVVPAAAHSPPVPPAGPPTRPPP